MAKHFDVVLSALILIAASSVSIFAYLEIAGLETQGAEVLTLPAKDSSLWVKSKNVCVGQLENKVVQENQSIVISSKGELNIVVGGKHYPINFKLESFFNPLNQLGKFSFEMKSKVFSINANGSGVNPIAVQIGSLANGKVLNKSFSIPGPVLVRKVADNLAFDYPVLLKHSSNNSRTFFKNILKGLTRDDLSVDPKQSETCERGKLQIESISPTMSLLPGLLK